MGAGGLSRGAICAVALLVTTTGWAQRQATQAAAGRDGGAFQEAAARARATGQPLVVFGMSDT